MRARQSHLFQLWLWRQGKELTSVDTVLCVGLNVAAVLLELRVDHEERLDANVVLVRHFRAGVVVDAARRRALLSTVDLAGLGRGTVAVVSGRLVGHLEGKAVGWVAPGVRLALIFGDSWCYQGREGEQLDVHEAGEGRGAE